MPGGLLDPQPVDFGMDASAELAAARAFDDRYPVAPLYVDGSALLKLVQLEAESTAIHAYLEDTRPGARSRAY